MKQVLWLITVLAAVIALAGNVLAATPLGFANTNITVSAQVGITCVEAQHGSFPSPLTINTETGSDQTFSPITDELVRCTNGVVFTVKVTSANGTAIDQTCTSSGISTMALKSASWPSDAISYVFTCAGDTTGTGNFTGAGSTSRALGIGIKVLAANAQSAIAHDDYADTVTLTISY